MERDFFHATECRVCGHSDFVKVLDLGEMPPANSFLKKEELPLPEKKFPLVVYFCKTCSLLQLLDVVDPRILFKNYSYLTSASKPLVEHFQTMAEKLTERFLQSSQNLVVEIGGNDGSLLQAFQGKFRLLNIEPAENVAELSRAKGIETVSEFFSAASAKKLHAIYGEASLVVANNVMAHIHEMRDVMEGIRIFLGDKGVFVFEVHWVENLIGEGGFDQIYHEHLCYYSLHAISNLVQQVGLSVFDVEVVPSHGASLRVYVAKNKKKEPSVQLLIEKEKSLGLNKERVFLDFGKRVEENKNELRETLLEIQKAGKKVIGYGAPAKGNTLLNYCRIDTTLLDCITDTTPLKQGMYAPGVHIPIVSPEEIKTRMPDYLLLLAWNYADAIMRKEALFRERGGKFIVPIPRVKIL